MEMQPLKQRRFEARTAIVTGAARGIGRGIAQRLAEEGCRIACWDNDVSSLESGDGSFAALVQDVDLADARAVEAAFAATLESFGHVDIVVNNAAVIQNGPIDSFAREVFEEHYAVNVGGPFFLVATALESLRASEDAAVVNVSSSVGSIVKPGSMLYGSTKAAG